jgi:hypothetical protein
VGALLHMLPWDESGAGLTTTPVVRLTTPITAPATGIEL